MPMNDAPSPADPAFDNQARADLETWREDYVARLAAPDGPWAACALVWLGDGVTRVGSAGGAEVRLPATAPPLAARLVRTGAGVSVTPSSPGALWVDGAPLDGPALIDRRDRLFATGADPLAPRFVVLVRGARHGVRVYDPRRATERDPQRHVAWYPLTPGWRVWGRLEPAVDGATLPVVNVLGDTIDAPAAGWLRFRLEGGEHALLATWAGANLFVNLRDAGSGPESYGAGRFLLVVPGADGRALLDFHRLHHPPCAHTPFATCPLPPLANRLPFVLRAGERHTTDHTSPPERRPESVNRR